MQKRDALTAGWKQVVLVESIGATRLRRLVTTWPGEVSIDIRRCDSCSGSIARKGRER